MAAKYVQNLKNTSSNTRRMIGDSYGEIREVFVMETAINSKVRYRNGVYAGPRLVPS